jgi:hypothetical protein
MKSFKEFMLPDYPMQIDHTKDNGEWVTGDAPKPIEGFEYYDTKSVIDKARQQIMKDRK